MKNTQDGSIKIEDFINYWTQKEGGTYQGEWLHDKREGFGVYTQLDG